MIDCIKAQIEHKKDGPQCRCVHPQADAFKQLVSEDICSACPLRIARRIKLPENAVGGVVLMDVLPETQHGGQLWLENGQFVEKVGDGHSFLLGDWVESRLTAVGMTKEKWVEIKSSVGLPPTCECEERQEWLNQVGTKFGAAMKSSFAKLWGLS